MDTTKLAGPFTDYLGEVYGVLVPLQFLFAVPIAWATTR